MPSRLAIQPVVTLLFAGLLVCCWWLDQRTGTVGVAGDDARFGFRLVESAEAHGVSFRHVQTSLHPSIRNVEPHVAALGAAVSIADVNADGWPDIYTTSSAFGTPNALFLNQGDGNFRDVAAEAGLADLNREGEGASMGSIWGDIDNDGDEDVYVIKWGYAQLFRNDGDLRFTDITPDSGLRRWMNSNGAVWFDYDRDGRLDLYVAGYFPAEFDLWDL
ncbi:MAG: FG-GAP repeat domain-containing protein, partial [Planctomycetota bacterium]